MCDVGHAYPETAENSSLRITVSPSMAPHYSSSATPKAWT